MARRHSFETAMLLVLAGCGGSGGDSSPQTQAPPGSYSITSANGAEAAAVSYRSAQQSAGMADLVGNSLIADSGGDTLQAQAAGSLAKPLRSAVASIPFGPETLPCQMSGTITISGDLADPLTLTAGDWILIDANACDDGLGEVIDGTIDFTVDTFSGDIFSGLYLLTMDLEVTDFQVTTAEDVILSSGDVTATIDSRTAPSVAAAVTGSSMTTSSNSSTETLSDFGSSQTLDASVSPSPWTLQSSGDLSSSRLEGPVSYSTPVMFEGFDSGNPSAGELLVVAPDGTSARLIAVDDVNVLIEVDTDGDGEPDDSIETTWAELLS